MAIELMGKIKPKGGGTFAMVDASDVEMADGTRLEEALEDIKGAGHVTQDEPPEDTRLLWIDTSDNSENAPEVDTDDEGKIIQVVDGVWTAIPVAESKVATYIEEYINSALGGEY